MFKIFNNWLGGQYCKVEVLDTRVRDWTRQDGSTFKVNESLVKFPESRDAVALEVNGDGKEPVWIESEQLDDTPEPGFREWTGIGVFAV